MELALILRHEINMAKLDSLKDKVIFMIKEKYREKPIFERDFPASLPEKRILSFKKTTLSKGNKISEELQELLCTLLALIHDFNRLIEHINSDILPPYSS
jgi:hypothetical protein